MNILIFFIFFIGFFYNFSKKVSMLLTLEGLMLMIIFFLGSVASFTVFSCFLCLLLSIFMVLDSVLGMTLLISSVRLNSVLYYGFFCL